MTEDSTVVKRQLSSHQQRQSPIGAETSDEETILNAVHQIDFGTTTEDWEPWEEEEEADNKDDGSHSESDHHHEDEHLMAVSSEPVVKKKAVQKESVDADDFFADMTPVIKPTDRVVIEKTTDDKFAVNVDAGAGWSDVDDETWS